jgi:predicted transcriptional regulator
MMSKQIMGFRKLIDEMQSVAQGSQPPPPRKERVVYASQAARTFAQKIQKQATDSPQANSGQALLNITSLAGVTRLISRENQQLLQIIATGNVTSLADLAGKTNRAESNLSRTLKKLEAVGVLELVPGLGRAKIPRLSVESFRVEIDVVTGQVQMVSARKTASRPALIPAPLARRPDHRVKPGRRAVAPV